MISRKKHLTEFSNLVLNIANKRVLYYWDFPNEYSTLDQELWMYTVLGLNHLGADKCRKLLFDAQLLEFSNEKWKEHMDYVSDNDFKQKFIDYGQFIDRLYN